MRVFARLAAAATAAGMLLVPAAGIASAGTARPAAPAHIRVHSGTSTYVTTAPGIAAALVTHGIVPIPTGPATEKLFNRSTGPVARFSFPVTGGEVSLSPLGGMVNHSGGVAFLNLRNGKSLAVGSFTINLSHGLLTGAVLGTKLRVPVFTLDLSHAKLAAGKHVVRASGVGLKLTAVAAAALNKVLKVKIFAGGLWFGTASTTLRV